MRSITSIKTSLSAGSYDMMLKSLYCRPADQLGPYRDRIVRVLDGFMKEFGASADTEVSVYSAPGRTEIGGNHTDHQRGKVLTGSVDLDAIACAAPNGSNDVRIYSEGYGLTTVDISSLEPVKEEENTTKAIIRGTLAAISSRGYEVKGFDAYVTSDVPGGSGLSSSACFEVLIGVTVNGLFCANSIPLAEIAKIGQYAENVYFGKPSGLMDQTASSVGNLITIDFADPAAPVVRKLDVDFEKSGLKLCIINCWASHADLTDEYAAAPVEMQNVAGYFGKKVLREVAKEDFMNAIPELRRQFGDRAVLRSIHFYQDNERVPKQVEALEAGDIESFLALVKESGRSSWMYLQNIVPTGANEHQEMAVALALCDELLEGAGAFRVHGGGFAGTCQAFVPQEKIGEFTKRMDQLLGEGSCHVLNIRSVGGTVVG